MNPEQIAFAKRYRHFLMLIEVLVCLLPRWFYPVLARTLGRWLNPYQLRADEIQKGMRIALTPSLVKSAWMDWLDSHTRFTLDFLNYKALDADWLQCAIEVEDPVLLAALQQSGGLLLTYHTHHQNTLCCALGLAGCQVSAIAAAPEESPTFPYIGRWAQRVNADSERHFRSGKYIFTNNKRVLARSIRSCLNNKSILVCLCDFHQPSVTGPVGHIFDRQLSPPTGTVELALKHQSPIFAAVFAPHNGRLRLQLKRLPAEDGLTPVMAGYLAFLEVCARDNPCCWQGWEWLAELPLRDN